MIETPITSREEWLAGRRSAVGASEVAALFGVQPAYAMSHWTLWQVKAGRIPEPDFGGERPAWGLRLEDAIIAAAAEKHGWQYRRAGHVKHPLVDGFACTPDFFLLNDDGDPVAIAETKNADWLIYKRQWGGEPPPHILLQVQSQMSCTCLDSAYVPALVGGNDLHVFPIARRQKIIAEIERRVCAFWRSIAEGKEPPIDDSDSTAKALAAMYPSDDGEDEPVDMSADNELPNLCAAYLQDAEAARVIKKRVQGYRSAIIAKLGERRAGKCNGFLFRAPTSDATPDRVITEEDVGQVIKGRAGARRLTVKELLA